MDSLKINFLELFDHLLTYLHPRDKIALSMASKMYMHCYPVDFAQWRRNIIPVNEFIGNIWYRIEPPMDISKFVDPGCTFPIHAGSSIVRYNGYNGKRVIYSYYGTYTRTVTYCDSTYKGSGVKFSIRDPGKVLRTTYCY